MPKLIQVTVAPLAPHQVGSSHPGTFESFRALAQLEEKYYRLGHNPNFTYSQIYRHLYCRKIFVKWFREACQSARAEPQIAAISTSIYDRYTSAVGTDSFEFEELRLIAACALYIAVKTHASPAYTSSHIVELSSGSFNTTELLSMENKVLKTLDWHVNPPTLVHFTNELLNVLHPSTQCREALQRVLDIQVERLMFCDHYIFHRKAEMAFPVFLNALSQVNTHTGSLLTNAEVDNFESRLSNELNIFSRSAEMRGFRTNIARHVNEESKLLSRSAFA